MNDVARKIARLRNAWTLMSFVVVLFTASGQLRAATPEESQAKIRQQSDEVLELLFKTQPKAKAAIAQSKGYATFSKWGLKLGVVGGSKGKGLVVANPSGKQTFMTYVEGSAGVGVGLKKYALVFVFETDQALSNFINKGWEAGGQATVAIKSKKGGTSLDGAASVSPGVWVYQITEKGLSAEIGLKGTKYYPDTKLN